MSLISELQRRRVPKVLGIYMAVAFALSQGVQLLADALNLPDWVLMVVVVIALALFPVVAILAWIYDFTKQGVVRTPVVDERAPFRWSVTSAGTVGLAAAVLLVGGWIALKPRAAAPVRVMVMPLQNRSGAPALDQLGEIAAEWITEGLVRAGFVEVVDVNLSLASASVSPQTAESMGAGAIVSGNFYREADNVLFQVRITRADGTLLEALPPVRGPAADPTRGLLPLRDRVIGALAVRYDAKASGFEGENAVPPSYAAYQAYVIGLHEYLAGNFSVAAERFQAAAGDTSFVRTLLWAAVSHQLSGNQPAADSAWARLSVREAELSPYDRSRAHFFDAIFKGDLETAYQNSLVMLEASPGSDDAAREVALSALRTWRLQEALEHLDRIAERPLIIRDWPVYWYVRVLALEQMGDLKRALEVAREGVRKNPGGESRLAEAMILADLGRVPEVLALIETIPLQIADVFEPLALVAARLTARGDTAGAARVMDLALRRAGQGPPYWRAWTYYVAGRYAESQQVADSIPTQGQSLMRSAVGLGLQGALAVRRGDTLAARQSLRALEALPGAHYVEYTRARIHALLGEREKAVQLVGRTMFDFNLDIPTRIHPDFVSLRGDPRFEALMQPRR